MSQRVSATARQGGRAELVPRQPGPLRGWQRTTFVATDAGTGSGVWLDATTVATCAHVVASARTIHVGNFPELHPAVAIAIDQSTDIAILRSAAAMPLSRATYAVPPSPATPVWIFGHPLGALTKRIHHAYVSGYDMLNVNGGAVPSIVLDGHVNCGNSGGPLCDDEGNLIGIIAAKSPKIPETDGANRALVHNLNALVNNGIGYAIPAAYVQELCVHAAEMQKATANRYEKYPPQYRNVNPADIAAIQRHARENGSNPLGPFSFTRDGELHIGWTGETIARIDESVDSLTNSLL